MTIRCIPKDEWTKGEIDYLVPARQVAHIVVSADMLTGGMPYKAYDRTFLFGIDIWEIPVDEFPAKDGMQKKIADMRTITLERLG